MKQWEKTDIKIVMGGVSRTLELSPTSPRVDWASYARIRRWDKNKNENDGERKSGLAGP
jgi:hypothetical protein